MMLLRDARLLSRLMLIFTLWTQGDMVAWGEDSTALEVEAVAEKVEKKAERTEKSEGKNDLVEDSVEVKTDSNGEKVIEQQGEASFYGKGFHGKTTAAGGKFNQHDHTAAHPTLPLGSEATVTNLDNGASVDVENNARGPHVTGRDIDLSEKAAKEIGLDEEGAVPVKIEAKIPAQDKNKDKDEKN